MALVRRRGDGRKRGRYRREARGRWMSHRRRLALRHRRVSCRRLALHHRRVSRRHRKTEPSHAHGSPTAYAAAADALRRHRVSRHHHETEPSHAHGSSTAYAAADTAAADAAADACQVWSLASISFPGGSEWRFLSGPWEGRKARICWDFYWGRPNRTVFYGLNHFFTDRIFSAGKAIFWPRIGPTERSPRLMIFRMSAFQWRTRISILSVHSEPKNWRI
jgi:hypothetical protein